MLLIVILRPSLIYGSSAFSTIKRPLFIQWVFQTIQQQIESSDNKNNNTNDVCFYSNEYRSPTFLDDILCVIDIIINRYTNNNNKNGFIGETFNVGNRKRLSRAEMATIVKDYILQTRANHNNNNYDDDAIIKTAPVPSK